MDDNTVDQLHTLTSRLQEYLVEAKDLRMRLTNALEANIWPELRSASGRVTDIPGQRDARASEERRSRQRLS